MFKSILIVDDEVDLAEILANFLQTCNYQVKIAYNGTEALDALKAQSFDLVLSDIHMPGMTGLSLLRSAKSELAQVPVWIFMSGNPSPELFESTNSLGAVDIIQKPFSLDSLPKLFKKIEQRTANPLAEVMELVQSISGIQLGPSKKLVTETRLMRRARALGLDTVTEYLEFFKNHRESEVKELVSILTTHTTEFFRESDHFDYFLDRVIPALYRPDRPLKIWSAASSTGQELISLVICMAEFLEQNGSHISKCHHIEFVGTDIDHDSVAKASEGIYEIGLLRGLNQDLIQKYFDVGEGDLEGLVRAKDFIFDRCRYHQMNLLSTNWNVEQFDVVFLRNVLIYFRPSDVETIANHIAAHIKPNGFLFLGHSESLASLKTKFHTVGNSIYALSPRSLSVPKHSFNSASSPQIAEMAQKPVRVFIIDDSVTIRMMLRKMLNVSEGFEVVGEAVNPIEADKLMAGKSIDVITLDIHMPEMDGITYLEKLRSRAHPPVVMVSSVSYDDAVSAMKCFELGAVDYIEKPSQSSLESEADRVRSVLRSVAHSKLKSGDIAHFSRTNWTLAREGKFLGQELLAIGASTGGVEALQVVLQQMPEVSPPILIVQHIPKNFSRALAKRLNELCRILVKEAEHGETVELSTAYIAPGATQMRVIHSGGKLEIEITDDAPVNRHKPSVDYMFSSLAKISGKFEISAAILTGMGADGAQGIKELFDVGAHTIAQDEASCVVFGMPKEAIQTGGVKEVLPLPSIAYHMLKSLTKKAAA